MRSIRLASVFVVAVSLIVLTGCGVSKGKYEALLNEKITLEEKVDVLTKSRDALKNEYDNLLKEKMDISTKLQTLTSEKTALKGEYDKLLDEKIVIKAAHDKLVAENKKMQDRLSSRGMQ